MSEDLQCQISVICYCCMAFRSIFSTESIRCSSVCLKWETSVCLCGRGRVCLLVAGLFLSLSHSSSLFVAICLMIYRAPGNTHKSNTTSEDIRLKWMHTKEILAVCSIICHFLHLPIWEYLWDPVETPAAQTVYFWHHRYSVILTVTDWFISDREVTGVYMGGYMHLTFLLDLKDAHNGT